MMCFFHCRRENFMTQESELSIMSELVNVTRQLALIGVSHFFLIK